MLAIPTKLSTMRSCLSLEFKNKPHNPLLITAFSPASFNDQMARLKWLTVKSKNKISSPEQAMCGEYVEETRDLIRDVAKDRKLTKITQVWSFFSERVWFKVN
ncbi:hypothetical protein Peur_050630 [Populus x canadensis]